MLEKIKNKHKLWFGNKTILKLLVVIFIISIISHGFIYAIIEMAIVCLIFPPFTIFLDYIVDKVKKK